ncbi:transcriptional regulator [Actinorhabdospora filicis]|uniref:Transcriptional regulator n=1 Tax=Actinorhabdospora filicis TaxID=1785913 RepID=A0A9W6SU19_9ACTN|nr:helix-turn-helix transcriptional regulator [Actinorhabdospora filicis]GLZ81954.1 transcriptional regulator [Actinorhabdospora filicis]
MHPAESSPTVAARLLANELRRLRMAAGLSQADVAGELGCAPARVGHLETRRNQVRRSDLLVMLQLYKVPVERQVWYLDLAVKAKEKGWWDRASGVPEWFSSLIGLEWGATQIQTFELSVIPGLLQTRGYIEALFRDDPERPEDVIREFAEQRLRRQEALTRDRPMLLHAILDEAALRRMVGGPEVMREQLGHLVEVNQQPHIRVQVLPFVRGAVPGLESGFHLIGFGVEADPGVVYLETQIGGIFLEEENEITTYEVSWAKLTRSALTPDESSAMIKSLMKETK